MNFQKMVDDKVFPDVVRGWTRDPFVYDEGSGVVGDYARGPIIEVAHKKVIDGTEVAILVTTFLETRAGESDADEYPNADIFGVQQTAEEIGPEGCAKYEYEQLDSPSLHLVDGEVPEDALEWLLCHGNVEFRDHISSSLEER